MFIRNVLEIKAGRIISKNGIFVSYIKRVWTRLMKLRKEKIYKSALMASLQTDLYLDYLHSLNKGL
jgi:hypothetical protein